jgi:hypothetical protein
MLKLPNCKANSLSRQHLPDVAESHSIIGSEKKHIIRIRHVTCKVAGAEVNRCIMTDI